MTLPSEYTFRKPENLVNDLQEMYRVLRESIEGFTREFEGKIYGSGTEGVGTYTTNDCFYMRRANVVDIFYSLAWSGHTGAGDIRIQLPFFEKQFASNTGISSIATENLTWPTGTTYCVVEGVANQDYATIQGCRDAGTKQTVQIDTAATINFHHRYIGQVQK